MITNKYLAKIIDEYLSKSLFEHELLDTTKYIRNILNKGWFYSNHFYSFKYGSISIDIKIKYIDDKTSYYYGRWRIAFLINNY